MRGVIFDIFGGGLMWSVNFSQEISLVGGDAEKFLACRKDAMQSALAKLVVRKKAKNIDDFIALYQPPGTYSC